MLSDRDVRTLETEVARFRALYPHSAVRFAQVLGRRVAHVAGSATDLPVGEARVSVTPAVVMFAEDRDGIGAARLEAFAAEVAAALGGN